MIRSAVALLLGCLLMAATAHAQEMRVTGPIYYGAAEGAAAVGVVEIRTVYASNPAFMRLRALGLSETDGGRGQRLFDEAQTAARRALAQVASDNGLDVITEVGGVVDASEEPVDFSQQVIEGLPRFHVEGKVLHGSARGARTLASIDSQQLLNAIPAYVEWLSSDPSEARYHLLQKEYQDAFGQAVRQVARDERLDVLVEVGAATARSGVVDDVTPQAVSALAG